MPWSALGEPGRSQPAPPNQAVLGKRIDRVLTAGRNESARRRAQRRDHVPVQLDQEDQPRTPTALPALPTRRTAPTCSPVRSRQLESAPQAASQLLFQPRRRHVAATRQRPDHHLIGSDGDRPTSFGRRAAADARPDGARRPNPTALPTISPTRGDPRSSSRSLPRRTWTMTSGCAARTPYFTVASNSVDRLMRLRAESTARKPVGAIRQKARGGPCGAGRTRSHARPGCACASRKPCTRARRRLFGWKVRLPLATAFSSVCLAVSSHPAAQLLNESSAGRSESGLATAGRRGPQALTWVAAASPTFGRLYEGTDRLRLVKPGLPQRTALTRRRKYHPWPAHYTSPRTDARPGDPKQADWNAAERLAAARKTVSFGQCRFRLQRRSTTKRGWRID